MNDITLVDLFEVGAHFGHQARYWNPKMAPYIFKTKNNIHIIDLDKTLKLYKEAVNFLASVAAKRGKILFVGTKRAAQDVIAEEAARCGMPYVNNRWLGGMLTNYKTVKQSIKHLGELERVRDSEEFKNYSKKEALVITRQISKLEASFNGIRNMGSLPDAIFVVDVGHEKNAVEEANKLKIPVVAIVDTNRDMKNISYMIPANDDSSSAIKLYVKGIADAIIFAKESLPIEELVLANKDFVKKASSSAKKPAKARQQKTVLVKNVKDSIDVVKASDSSSDDITAAVITSESEEK